MWIKLKRLFMSFVLLVCIACTPNEYQQKIIFLEIVEAEKVFMDAFKQFDVIKLANLYAKDGQIFPANNEVVEGSHNIASFWQGLMRLGIASVKLKTVEVEGTGEIVHEVGRYTIHTQDGEIIDFGKYLVIWKKEEGRWALYRHMWTTSMTQQAGLKI